MSFDLVFFGGTGDLTWRKLMPSLFQAWRHGKLPRDGRILAVARDDSDDARYRQWLQERLQEAESAKRPTADEFTQFSAQIHYLRMDLSVPADYDKLKAWLNQRQADTTVMYLATSPHLFPVICQQLGACGLNHDKVRVVLEKPLGHDLASAQDINRAVSAVFSERQALRIDHYLGKPSVQNLMALRFGNVLFEPLWRRESIANIQITLAESLGVGTRGDFYDRTGALRDMIQNHALQLLTMVAMEPPLSADADAIRDEKLKVLKSLKPFDLTSVARDVVRGQYRNGMMDGKPVNGYLDASKGPPDSHTETFVALRCEVLNQPAVKHRHPFRCCCTHFVHHSRSHGTSVSPQSLQRSGASRPTGRSSGGAAAGACFGSVFMGAPLTFDVGRLNRYRRSGPRDSSARGLQRIT